MKIPKGLFDKFGRTCLTAVVFLFCSVSAFAQLTTGKIEGTVRDKDTGAPMAGTQVMVEGTRLGNVTNSDGYYFILNVPPGRRFITFSFTGYQITTVADQLVLAGQTMTVDAGLSSTIVELEGITVEAEADPLVPRDNTVTKQRLTRETMNETPADKLEDMMLLEAGVQAGGPDALARGFRIRGGRLGEEAMVVDGLMVRHYYADPFRSGVGWAWEQEIGSRAEDASPLELSAGAVEQVDIITGGFQAEYGDAQSGIVNIVTREGGPDLKGRVRLTTDGVMPRTADWGYNQLTADIGGPVPLVPNLYFHGSGEIQGTADRTPTHADEGFRGINQNFIDRLNHAVRNDPVLGKEMPAFSLEDFQKGREFYSSKTGASASLFIPGNPVRLPGNWGDRTLTSAKLTYSPHGRLKFISSVNFSRNQNSYPTGEKGQGNYFETGFITKSTLPTRAWELDAPDTIAFIPQSFARRTRTSNLLFGVNWDFYRTPSRSASLQLRFADFRVQDIKSASLKDNYTRENTFMSWTPHDIPFEVETFPDKVLPLQNTENARIHYPNGIGDMSSYTYETPLKLEFGNLYLLTYLYEREEQSNLKLDFDFQLDRWNRVKAGVAFTTLSSRWFMGESWGKRYELDNPWRSRTYAIYLQNRTDLGDFVIDYGLRYDRFMPREAEMMAVFKGDNWVENHFYKDLSEMSPRFDVAFPVTDRSQLRFSYGVFTQLPSTYYFFGVSIRNPGELEYSRTDAFETGFSYLLSENMVVDLAAYYRDVDGNVSSWKFWRDYYRWHEERRVRFMDSGMTNRDNGNIKGLDLTLRKRFSDNFAFNIMYTLQFSRTTGSNYLSTDGWDKFLDPATGEEYIPPDEIRPINGDRTHQLTANFNLLFPDDFSAGTLANTILKNVRIYPVFTLSSGEPLSERMNVLRGILNASEDFSYLSWRGGRPIGGINYFRGRWNYNLDLRVTKSFRILGTRRISVFADIFTVLNNKLPGVYPSEYKYEDYYYLWGGGEKIVWSDDYLGPETSLWEKRVYFNSDFNQDGVLSLTEQAKGEIAYNMIDATMDKTPWGRPRQVRLGLEFTF